MLDRPIAVGEAFDGQLVRLVAQAKMPRAVVIVQCASDGLGSSNEYVLLGVARMSMMCLSL